jgi:hypothetical protein
MNSFSRSGLLDERLMPSGFNVMLALYMATCIHIKLSGLKANRLHILDLLSLVVGLQASYNRRGYLFMYVSLLLNVYKF